MSQPPPRDSGAATAPPGPSWYLPRQASARDMTYCILILFYPSGHGCRHRSSSDLLNPHKHYPVVTQWPTQDMMREEQDRSSQLQLHYLQLNPTLLPLPLLQNGFIFQCPQDLYVVDWTRSNVLLTSDRFKFQCHQNLMR